MVSHHKERGENLGPREVGNNRERLSHTIDGNGNSLRQVEAIGTLEGGDLASGVNLGELRAAVEGSGRVSLGVDQLQLQVVVLSSDQDGEGATVVLEGSATAKDIKDREKNIQADRKAFRRPF
jgi:hypothetical protein